MQISLLNRNSANQSFKSRLSPVVLEAVNSRARAKEFPVSIEIYNLLTKFEKWLLVLSNRHPELAVKYANSDLGLLLSQKLYEKFLVSKVDYSDSVTNLRDAVAEKVEGFRLPCDENSTSRSLAANVYIVCQLEGIISAIRILGEDAVREALKWRQHRFEKFVTDVDVYNYSTIDETQEVLQKKTNPINSYAYKKLLKLKELVELRMHSPANEAFYKQHNIIKSVIAGYQEQVKICKQQKNLAGVKELLAKITELRRQDNSAKPEGFKELEKEMTEIKAKINALFAQAIKDPLKKLEAFKLNNSIKNFASNDELEKLNEILAMDEENKLLDFLSEQIQFKTSLSDRQKETFFKYNLHKSPYFPKLFQASVAFMQNFRTMLTVLDTDIDVAEQFETLEQNKLTRQMFEERGLNYDAWVGIDKHCDFYHFGEGKYTRKVDMNDIKHSLFLGNQAICCTAVGGGTREHFAPNYIMNKLVQALELVVDGVTVGNTMCYIADIKDKGLTFVLDNIEVLNPYRDDMENFDAFVALAKKITQNIGACNMPIIVGHRNKFELKEKFSEEAYNDIQVLGTSGEQELHLDSLAGLSIMNEPITPNGHYYGKFFNIRF